MCEVNILRQHKPFLCIKRPRTFLSITTVVCNTNTPKKINERQNNVFFICKVCTCILKFKDFQYLVFVVSFTKENQFSMLGPSPIHHLHLDRQRNHTQKKLIEHVYLTPINKFDCNSISTTRKTMYFIRNQLYLIRVQL